MLEGGVEPSNVNVPTEDMNTELTEPHTAKIPAKAEAELGAEASLVPAAAPAPENGHPLAPANASGETALENTTYDNETGNEERDDEGDEPSPLTGNEDTDLGADDPDNENDVDLIAVAALAIPQAGATTQYAFDISNLPNLSPLITRKDISRRDLPLICHVVGCNLGLGPQAEYYQRYRICKEHLRSAALLVDGIPQRFCQQCGKFHDLDAFDGDKRNCRARLAQHNSRRRKAGAGATPPVLPYGQGPNGRKRIPTSFEGFNTQFEFDYPGSGGESRRKRARIPVSKEFPPPPKAQRMSRPPKYRRDSEEEEEDNGFLDQLLAAANGLQEEEERSEEDQYNTGQRQQRQRQPNSRYYPQDAGEDAGGDDEPYTYDPTASAHQIHAPAPVRLTSRPVAPAYQAPYNNNGGRPGALPPGALPRPNGGGPGGYSQFGGWPPHAGGALNGHYVPGPPSHMQYGLPPPGTGGVPPNAGGGATAMAAAVSELERVMGRQLLQSLMAGAGLPTAMAAPPPPQQPAAHQLLDMLRSLAGGAGTPPGAAPYYPPQQQQAVYQPQAAYAAAAPAPVAPAAATSPAAALASLLGGEAPQQDRVNAGAPNALEELRKLVGTLPNNGIAGAPAVAGAGASDGAEPVVPVVIKAEPVAADTAVAGPSTVSPPTAKPGSLIEQLADALKAQNEATNAVVGHQAAAALLEANGEPAAAAAAAVAAAVATVDGKKEASPPRSVASLAQQDIMRRLMAMLENNKAGPAVAAAAPAEAPAQPPAQHPGLSPELLMSLMQQGQAAVAAGATTAEVGQQEKPTPSPAS